MEKNIKINIAGLIFQIEDKAFEILKDYLQQINSRLKNQAGGNEMIEDIEARIAEIFQDCPSWKTGLISIEDVNEMIEKMGSPDEIAGDLEEERSTEQRNVGRRLYRDSDGAIIGGVCNGMGAYLRIDPVWIRIIFVLFTVLYLSGLLVYVVLWIALPKANTFAKRRELYNEKEPKKDYGKNIKNEINEAAVNVSNAGSEGAAKVGSAFNEIFRAFGKFFIILFRIIIAIVGVAFIIGGFSALISYIIIAFFQSPILMGSFLDTGLFNINDFLSVLVGPALAPWIIILTSLVVILPLLGMVYWGIRMVFQFRAKDLILNIAMFIIWIVSCAALSLLLFSEGISFSHSGRVSHEMQIEEETELHLVLAKDISTVSYDKVLSLPKNNIKFYLQETGENIYGTPEIDLYSTEEESYIKVTKYSSGRTTGHARKQADNIEYKLKLSNDTLLLDGFYTIPDGTMWPGANVKIRIYLNEGDRIYVDEKVEDFFEDYQGNGIYSYELGGNFWIMTDDGIKKD